MDSSYQVIVYDSTKEAYEKMMNVLPMLFADYGVSEEYPAEDVIGERAEQCRNTVFLGEMVPPLERNGFGTVYKVLCQSMIQLQNSIPLMILIEVAWMLVGLQSVSGMRIWVAENRWNT